VTWDGRWVLLGTVDGASKVFGPYDTADEAAEECNQLGLAHIAWEILPLQGPG